MNTDNLNLPWRVEGDDFPAIWDASNDLITEYDTEHSIAPCSKEVCGCIVEAVNSHASLVERVKELEGHLEKTTDYLERLCIASERPLDELEELTQQARKALQKKETE